MVALAAATAATTTADIAVIGAGAAGLVTARHLLRCGLRPTLLEASHEIGGMWTPSSSSPQQHQLDDDPNRKTWNTMRTNLSRYTCCFSDYPWSKAFAMEDEATIHQHHEDPLSYFFPTTNQMNEYLKRYCNHFLVGHEACTFRLGCQVTKVVPVPDNRYSVEWMPSAVSSKQEQGDLAEQPQTEQQIFDGVVVATGFFSDPSWPENADLSTFSGVHIHSSQYRSVEALNLETSTTNETTTIVVCGSSFSALEIAANLARGQSSSSSSSLISSRTVEDDKPTPRIPIVKHICSALPWVMPRFMTNEPSRGYVPLDTVLYRRPQDGLKTEALLGNDPKLNPQKHQYLTNLLGQRKQEQYFRDMDIAQPYDDPSLPLYATISNDYLDLVGSGRIEVIPGRLAGSDEQGSLQVKTRTDPKSMVGIDNADALISCTGYLTNLDFLHHESILQTIEFEPDNKFAPLQLCEDVYHPSLKNMAFVGMYRGPYFGVLQLQAQLAAARLARQVAGAETISPNLSVEEEAAQDEASLKNALRIREQVPQPQLPRSDYVGRMDSLVTRIKQLPYNCLGDSPFFANEGEMVIPALYQSDAALAESELNRLKQDLKSRCQTSGHVTPFLLQSLLGKWSFTRTLTQLSDYSSQSVEGIIQFSLQRDEELGEDYILYREDGTMELAGRQVEVFREYHYTLNKANGALEIFFVESGKRAHLFLSLLFDYNPSLRSWVASSDHLCIKDLYGGTFQVVLDGLAASHVEMKYNVKGPAKDYEARTILKPD